MIYKVKDAEGNVVAEFETDTIGPFTVEVTPPTNDAGGGPGPVKPDPIG